MARPARHREPAAAVARGAFWIGLAALLAPAAPQATAQPGWVLHQQKISETQGGFSGDLDDADLFGISVTALGDLDGDGVGDLAVGADRDDDGGLDRGAVWILFMRADGTVKTEQKISATAGDFDGLLENRDLFGHAVRRLPTFDGGGAPVLAAAALNGGAEGASEGALWMLRLTALGTVESHHRIGLDAGGFEGAIEPNDGFGSAVEPLPDIDGDGVDDLAVGAMWTDDGGEDRGAVWILFMNADGTVRDERKISDTAGGFEGILGNDDLFGQSLAALDDLDGDGIVEIAVGSRDDDGGRDTGAVWILFIDASGGVKSHRKISAKSGGFEGALETGDGFGIDLAALGDLDGDGIGDLAAGAFEDDDGGAGHGAVWLLFLAADGTVKSHGKISDTEGGFEGGLGARDWLGTSVGLLPDLDGDGRRDLLVGAAGTDDGGTQRGALWVLLLDGPRACAADLDDDHVVGFSDLLVLLNAWGSQGGPADLDGSGAVDFADVLALLAAWGPCPAA